MEQNARVISVERGFATVEIKRLAACDTCHKAESGCAVCSLLSSGAVHTSRVKDPIGVSVGDRVLLVANDSRILLYSLLVFILPLVSAAVAYAVAALVGASLVWRVASAAFFFIAFYVLLYFTVNKSEKRSPGIRIACVLPEGDTVGCSEKEDA